MQYRIESAITGDGYDLTFPGGDNGSDAGAAMLLMEQAAQTLWAYTSNTWNLLRDGRHVAQVRVVDGVATYWRSRNFDFRFFYQRVSRRAVV